MKLSDAYLCPNTDCEQIFSYKEQIHPYNHYPICPICGSKNALSLSRILNRKEEKNETSDQHDIVHSDGVPDSKSFNNGASSNGFFKKGEQVAIVGDQERIRRSRREDIAGNYISFSADGFARGIASLVDVLGVLLSAESSLKQAISRLDANSTKGTLSRCKLSDRSKDLSGEVKSN